MPPSAMGPEDLAALGDGWPDALDFEGLVAKACFSDQCYTRTILHHSPGWELLVIGWLPGQRTARHGHGESFGVTCVLAGSVLEVGYRLGPGGKVSRGERRKHGRGAVFYEQPDTIHHVEHAGRVRAVSLHLYAPPLRRMDLYETSTGTSQPRRSGRREPKSSIMER